MPDERRSEEPGEPALPEVPELPEAPELRPRLPPQPGAEPPNSEDLRRAGLAYTIPVALIAPVVVLTLVGWWLDGQFQMSPLFTLGGALLGFASGLINMIRIANRLNR